MVSYDDFSGASIDATKWSSYSGVSVSGGKAVLDSGETLVSATTFSRTTTIGAVIEASNVDSAWACGIAYGDGIPLAAYSPSYFVGVFNGSWYFVHSTASKYTVNQNLGVAATNGTQYNVEIALTSTQVLVRVWAVGSSKPGTPSYTYTNTTLDGKPIRFGHTGTSRTQSIDRVYVLSDADTVSATRYLGASITETGGHFAYADTVSATRYVGGSIAEAGGEASLDTTGYAFVIDGENYTTAKIINAQIRDRLNQVPRFDFRAHSLNATDLTHFKAGATVEIYYNGVKRCEGFIERFDEQQSSWFYDCTGYGVGQFLDHRRSDVPTLYPVGVQGENTVKDIITYIVNTSCGFPTTGATGWTIEGESGPDLLIFKIQNQKAMEHVAQLVQLADMDWFASFGAEGRVLTLGDASCVTHTATNLKLGRDILMSEEVTDLSKVANNIVIQSKDYFGNTILSSIGDYTNVCTVASSETLLKYDAQSGTTLLYVFDHADYPATGSLLVSTEVVNYTGKSTPASTLHPHFYGLTTTASHVAYEPVLFRDGFYITGATAPFLDASPGTIRVGREDISYASVYSVDATTACVSGTLTRGSNYYAHGREAPVFDTTYSLSNPTSTTSVATYGRKDEVISGIGYQDMNSLDLAAYGVLRRKCGWPTWGQGMIVGGDFPTAFPTVPKVGDWFYLEDATTTATTLQRITGLDYDMMRGQITINWGESEEYAVSDLKKSDIAMNQAMS